MTFRSHLLACSLIMAVVLLPIQVRSEVVFRAGPEIYYFQRDKEGGSKQTGAMYGIRGMLERIQPCSLYLGLDLFCAEGTIKGHSGSGRALSSEITDVIYEGRIGYMLQNNKANPSFIIPYCGYGHFRETNAFRPPSPLPFTFIDTFDYTLIGFLSGFNFTPLLSIGLNFETRFMLNGKSKLTNDPDFDDTTLIMNNELQARLELPITYNLSRCRCRTEVQLVPFYEYRHFGGREGFPFDFIDTKFNLIGLRFTLGCRF